MNKKSLFSERRFVYENGGPEETSPVVVETPEAVVKDDSEEKRDELKKEVEVDKVELDTSKGLEGLKGQLKDTYGDLETFLRKLEQLRFETMPLFKDGKLNVKESSFRGVILDHIANNITPQTWELIKGLFEGANIDFDEMKIKELVAAVLTDSAVDSVNNFYGDGKIEEFIKENEGSREKFQYKLSYKDGKFETKFSIVGDDALQTKLGEHNKKIEDEKAAGGGDVVPESDKDWAKSVEDSMLGKFLLIVFYEGKPEKLEEALKKKSLFVVLFSGLCGLPTKKYNDMVKNIKKNEKTAGVFTKLENGIKKTPLYNKDAAGKESGYPEWDWPTVSEGFDAKKPIGELKAGEKGFEPNRDYYSEGKYFMVKVPKGEKMEFASHVSVRVDDKPQTGGTLVGGKEYAVDYLPAGTKVPPGTILKKVKVEA